MAAHLSSVEREILRHGETVAIIVQILAFSGGKKQGCWTADLKKDCSIEIFSCCLLAACT